MAIVNGWIALILFITSFYLAIRIPFVNRLFDGLKDQLQLHHWIAMFSVMFMFFHSTEIFLHFKRHLDLLFDWRDIGLLSGWITFAGIVLAMPFSFYRVQIPYRQWRLIHLITSVSLVTALIHTFLLFEPIDFIDWAIFLLVGLLAILALLLAIILPIFSFWGQKYLITTITEIRPKLFLLQLQPSVHQKRIEHFEFESGHFIYLKFSNFSRIWHPFTIISKPGDPYLELFIKARGIDTNRLGPMSLPASVRVLAPFGTAFWKTNQNQIWISYGVGAAIFLAAVRSFPPAFRKKIHFICCDSSLNKIFFSEELEDCMRCHANFTWEPYIGTGIEFIKEFKSRSLDINHIKKVRICGHPMFQKNLKSMLVSRGIKSKDIHLEGLL